MKHPIPLTFAICLMAGCNEAPKLQKGDKFLLKFGLSVDTWTVQGNNSNGYYCYPNWGDSTTLFFYDNSDLDTKEFKIISRSNPIHKK